MIKFGEFAPDVADYNLEVATVADNVVSIANGYGSIAPSEANSATGNTGVNRPRSAFAPIRGMGSTAFTGVTSGATDGSGNPKIYYRSTDISKVGLSKVSANSFYYFEFVPWGDDLIIAGNVNPIQTISNANIIASGNTADLGGSPPAALTAAKVRDFLVIGCTLDSGGTYHPYRLQWSGFDDRTEWTIGTNQSGFKDFDDGGNIYRVVETAGRGIIFQEDSVRVMDYVGVPAVWNFDRIQDAEGTLAPWSVVVSGGDVYYLGKSGFKVLRADGSYQGIGANKVDRWFYGQMGGAGFPELVSEGMSYFVVGAKDEASGCIWWSFRSSVPEGTDPNDRVIIYNPKTEQWSTATVDMETIFSIPVGESSGVFPENKIGYFAQVGANYHYHSIKDGNTGTDKAATIETGHIFDEQAKTEIIGVRPVIDGTSTVSVLTKANLPSDSETTSGPISLDSSGKADFRVEGRYHRVRCTTSGDFTRAVGVIVDQAPAGDR